MKLTTIQYGMGSQAIALLLLSVSTACASEDVMPVAIDSKAEQVVLTEPTKTVSSTGASVAHMSIGTDGKMQQVGGDEISADDLANGPLKHHFETAQMLDIEHLADHLADVSATKLDEMEAMVHKEAREQIEAALKLEHDFRLFRQKEMEKIRTARKQVQKGAELITQGRFMVEDAKLQELTKIAEEASVQEKAADQSLSTASEAKEGSPEDVADLLKKVESAKASIRVGKRTVSQVEGTNAMVEETQQMVSQLQEAIRSEAVNLEVPTQIGAPTQQSRSQPEQQQTVRVERSVRTEETVTVV